MPRVRRVLAAFVSVTLFGCQTDTPLDPIDPPDFLAAKVKPTNTALDFNDSWVTVADDPALDLSTTWTLEAWIKPRTGTGYQHILSKWNGGGNSSYTLEVHDGRLRTAIHDGVVNSVVESSGMLTIGEWQHVSVVYDNGTMGMYINGALDNTATGLVTPMNSDRTLSFGREGEPYGGWRYDGLIDEVRVFNIARKDRQIARSMYKRLSGKTKGLVGYWRFDEGTGDVAYDLSRSGLDGQLGNAVGPDVNDPTFTTDVPPIKY